MNRDHRLRHHAPEEESFQDAMQDALGSAPWLLLSLLAHAVAALLLYVLLEEEIRTAPKIATSVQQDEKPDEPEDEPVTPVEPPTVEPQEVEPEEQQFEPKDDRSPFEESVDPDNTPITSAMDSKHWNTALGLGAGAAGGGGGGGLGKRAGGCKPHPGVTHAALAWLAAHQDEDGRWDADGFMKHDRQGTPCDGAGSPVHDIGVTGLALLAFLGDGHDLSRGEYRGNVKRAVRWLRQQQEDNGRFGGASSRAYIYDHAIATLAMCECMGMSRSNLLRGNVRRAIGYLESHRNPYGAWRYQPRASGHDSSITGWGLMAMKSARDFGIPVDKNTFTAIASVFDELTDPNTGRCGYNQRGTASSRERGDHAILFPPEHGEALTAVGLMSRVFLGQKPKETPVMGKATQLLLNRLPKHNPKGAVDHYYWYYGSYALYQIGGQAWKRWQKALLPTVIKSQRKDGNFKGSWDPNGAWGESGGRVYSTAILALTMQVYYRYTRVLLR